MRDLLPTVFLTAGVLAVIMVMSLMPSAQGTVLVLYNPAETQESHIGAILDADALLVGEGKLPGSFLVSSDDAGLPGRLLANGALLVINPYGATGCAPRFGKSSAFATATEGRWE
jgi:hypothetical protein